MTDKRDKLQGQPFSYKTTKAGKVFIAWEGKQVKVMKEQEAQEFLAVIEDLSDFDSQLLMATMTGNFKRGNERLARNKRKQKYGD